MATVSEKAQLSAAVYGDYPVPKGWTAVGLPKENQDTGFFAQAFKNDKTGEIIISFRGTANDEGFANDLQFLKGEIPDQFVHALKYYNEIAEANPGANINLTGHSLGGMLAQLVKLELLKENPANKVTVEE